MIIYPPFIEDTIPGFTISDIKIPFVMNPAVSYNEITHFKLQIKNYSDSKLIIELTTTDCDYNEETKSGIIYFNQLEDLSNKIESGQYYKFQLAYGDTTNKEMKYYVYSIASIGRCIGEQAPVIQIRGKNHQELKRDQWNYNSSYFVGEYETSLLSEPLYSYRIYVQNQKTEEIIQDTGWTPHNSDLDKVNAKRISKHPFVLNYVLEEWVYYTITYQIKTINGFEDSITYSITKEGEFADNSGYTVYVSQDNKAKDNGYVLIQISWETPVLGIFELQRTSDGKRWDTLTTFKTSSISRNEVYNWKDWSIEQGVKYIYAIRRVAEGENYYSSRIESNPIQVEFDHIFLSDGNKQLKISYNPKISSLKDIILENKTDTIGSKYPFFFRNETVRYKEIPISGLLSYLSDDDELFLSNQELGITEQNPRTNNLSGYNFEAEKRFKLTVLDWLNNGQPKLFRSPAEGNYIVRLMNVSLSPNEQIGRLLHTFSSTAYEIDNYNLNNLFGYKLIDLPHIQDTIQQTEYTCSLKDVEANESGNFNLLKYITEYAVQKPIQNTIISNIKWTGTTGYLIIDDKKYYPTALKGFETPDGFECQSVIISSNAFGKNESGEITITYQTEDVIQTFTRRLNTSISILEDEFTKMIKTSADVCFTVPAGEVLYGDNGILKAEEDTAEEYVKIYQTYTLRVYKDETYEPTSLDENPYAFEFRYDDGTISTIDCSDGHLRYFSNIDQNTLYEKGKGLKIDVYARVGGQKEMNSSRLGEFILGVSILGGTN